MKVKWGGEKPAEKTHRILGSCVCSSRSRRPNQSSGRMDTEKRPLGIESRAPTQESSDLENLLPSICQREKSPCIISTKTCVQECS